MRIQGKLPGRCVFGEAEVRGETSCDGDRVRGPRRPRDENAGRKRGENERRRGERTDAPAADGAPGGRG